MKVAITGHLNGLGEALFQRLPGAIGFDVAPRSLNATTMWDSYDITKDYNQIAEKAHDCDVFINNAYDGRGQILMHNAIEKQWKHTNKLIINISSSTIHTYPNRNDEYAQVKRELEKISRYARCRCECIRVPLMNTQLVDGKKHERTHKINPDIVAKAIIEWHIS